MNSEGPLDLPIRDAPSSAGAPAPAAAGAPAEARLRSDKRTVCDHCRMRRIRCDRQFPCQHCQNARLTCKREHVPRKRGPKGGHGRVINELKARETIGRQQSSRESSSGLNDADDEIMTDGGPSAPESAATSPPDISWHNRASDPRNAPEPRSSYSSDQYQPTSRSYLHLMPQCVELYYEHIYPIMPLPFMPTVRDLVRRPATMTVSEKNFIYSMCALTSFHMKGQSIQTSGVDSWEVVGRFFLDECIAVRQSYDFAEDVSLYAAMSSFWLSTSFFEINQSRKSWLYLREAVTLALDLGLDDESNYEGLDPTETLCRQRIYWQLFVTERSFAILRKKPISFRKMPAFPTTRHAYESQEIQSGFTQLISAYLPLDESFVNAWNNIRDPRVNASTYLNLQIMLDRMPPFFSRKSSRNGAYGVPNPDEPPEPTAIQKADLLITQQWLRLIVWQSSLHRRLLRWTHPDRCMNYTFPLDIAHRTASILHELPKTAVEVHGMGIFEKIFEIGTWCFNVLDASDSTALAVSPLHGPGAGGLGMDFVGQDDLGILGQGRIGGAIDPLEFFVQTLSASPNSRTQFADKLLMFAKERPSGLRMSLSPALSAPSTPGFAPAGLVWNHAVPSQPANSAPGSVLGEVKDEEELYSDAARMSSLDVNSGPILDGDVSAYTNQGYGNMPTLGDMSGAQNTYYFPQNVSDTEIDAWSASQSTGIESSGLVDNQGMRTTMMHPAYDLTTTISNESYDTPRQMNMGLGGNGVDMALHSRDASGSPSGSGSGTGTGTSMGLNGVGILQPDEYGDMGVW